MSSISQAEDIHFWNGNKTEARQKYELDLLKAILKVTEKEHGKANLVEDLSNYPSFDDEANVLRNGSDVLVTVAGNIKFIDRKKIVVQEDVSKGLLGFRLAIIRDDFQRQFAEISGAEQLSRLSIGIPETWLDAELFRSNGFAVVEKGQFDQLFYLLKDKEFEYTALGANEIELAFSRRAEPLGGLSIDKAILIYYPFPLVFYVNANKPRLAERVSLGLKQLKASEEFDAIFDLHHGDIVRRLKLENRQLIQLKNPGLPEYFSDYQSSLMSISH